MGFVKRVYDLGRGLSPWLSLAVPLGLLVILFALQALWPSLFCLAMTRNEFICGAQYSHPGIRILRLTGLFVWLLVFIAGGAELARGKSRWSGYIAWSFSALLLVSLLVLLVFSPVDTCP